MLYKTCTSLDLAPSEFWQMSPKEVGIWINANRPPQQIGAINERQAKAMTDRMHANPDKYA